MKQYKLTFTDITIHGSGDKYADEPIFDVNIYPNGKFINLPIQLEDERLFIDV